MKPAVTWPLAVLLSLAIASAHLLDGPSEIEREQHIADEAARIEAEAARICKKLMGDEAVHQWSRDNQLRCALQMSRGVGI